ncbi:MAG: PAS-domain containing protein [Holosporales bacterium]|jgi:signal transduction histidine kinase/PAS domain-containing protein|nr:PAS-domain containing protein [Holosporales bacterium]
MNFEAENNRSYDLLLDSALKLPIAFASWHLNSEEVFISDKLKLLISAEYNFLSAYDFIKYINDYFGNFLYVASEKISSLQEIKSEYSATIKSNFEEEFFTRLVFDRTKGLYIFTAETEIERKQDKNRRENNFTNNILNSIPLYIWQRNLDLQLTYCNKKYSDALETSQENVIANNLKLINHKKDKYIGYAPSAKKTIEKVVIKGSRRYLEITEQPFVGNSPAIGFAIDVTDREELKKEYKIYKKQTEETLSQISVPIAIFDEKMFLIFANSAVEKLFGLGANLFNEKNFSEIISILLDKGIILNDKGDKEFKEKAESFFTEVIEPYHTTLSIQNGKIMNVTISPNQGGGLIFLFEDISDTISLKREVSSIFAVQQDTLDHLQEGVVIFGTDNRVKIINSVMRDRGEDNKLERYEETHIKEFLEKVFNMSESSPKPEFWIAKIISMSTQRIQFSDSLSLPSGKVMDYGYFPLPEGLNLIRFSDATDRINLEKAISEKADIVSQLDKIKTSLISNVSFELRAPLNAIIGFSDILSKQYFGALNEKQLEYCHGISESVIKITEAVDAIIKLTGIEAGQIKLKYDEVNLFNFINDLLNLFKNVAETQNVTLTSAFENKEFIVYFDECSMKQAMFQIILKALKQTPAGGNITVSIETPATEPAYFSIIISNTGVGIAAEDLEKIKKVIANETGISLVDESIGFGTLLANSILRLHNGALSISSEYGKGTVVKSCLPIKR